MFVAILILLSLTFLVVTGMYGAVSHMRMLLVKLVEVKTAELEMWGKK